MSLYGVLRTGVSGMSAQSNKLGTIADNVANSGTVGYKRASTDFSSFVIDAGGTNYDSGSVSTKVAHMVDQQGPLSYTSSDTDLAIQGDGFLVVKDAQDVAYLTRAGSFTVDASSGNLVNTAGYTLLGYPVAADGSTSVVTNGTTGLTPINISGMNLRAKPSTEGTFLVNLPSSAAIVDPTAQNTPADNTGDVPADPTATPPVAAVTASKYTDKSSIVAYDNVGNAVTLDMFLTRTAADTWEVSVFNHADAPATGTFPYTGTEPLTTQQLKFDTNGNLSQVENAAGAAMSGLELDVPVPNGKTVKLDLTGMTQLASDYTPLNVAVNGNAPATVSGVKIDTDGTVYATYQNGGRAAAFRIPLARVQSPDNLTPVAGNAYSTTPESGDLQVGFPQEAGRGSLVSGALEQSNVDMASELTDMIVAQRDYTANSKVVQTGSDLLDVLMNLKR